MGVSGQLGNGVKLPIVQPLWMFAPATRKAAALRGVTDISLGSNYTCALTSRGNVKCWGGGGDRRLGDGASTDSSYPVDVCARRKETGESTCPLLSGVSAIELGSSHGCVLTHRGNIKCWGRGDEGRLGNGGYADTSYPANVCLRAKTNDEVSCPPLDELQRLAWEPHIVAL